MTRGVGWVTAAVVSVGAVLVAGVGPAAASGGVAGVPGTVSSWGNNGNGQADPALAAASRALPGPVTGLPGGVRQVAGGRGFSYALLADGTVRAWGFNGSGQLGFGTLSTTGGDRQGPGQVQVLSGITYLAAGQQHGLAVGAGGTVWGWGSNNCAQMGDGTLASARITPAPVPGLSGFIQVAAGECHSLGLKADGTVWAWGSNLFGQLGTGPNTGSILQKTPVQIAGLTGITQIGAAAEDSAALRSDGTVVTWGLNIDGELGVGDQNGRNVPTQVPGLTGITQLAVGWFHSLALTGDGHVFAWGDNFSGEIGDGTNGEGNRRLSPVQLGLTGITQIGAGAARSAGLRSDGTLLSWGLNGSGINFTGAPLGVGSTATFVPNPTPVQGLTNLGVLAFSMGEDTTMAITAPLVTVPDLTGDTQAAATAALQAAGLVLGQVTTFPDQHCAHIGTVGQQNPAPGTRVPAGTAVNIGIGTFPPHTC